MFNAAFTVHEKTAHIVEELSKILIRKEYQVEEPVIDDMQTQHLKAVNKSTMSMVQSILKHWGKDDFRGQRVGIHIAVMEDDGEQAGEKDHGRLDSHIFLSVYPMMEFLPLPELPGVSETEREKNADEILCMKVLDELAEWILDNFTDARENFRTLPMETRYQITDSRIVSRGNVEKIIQNILQELEFEVIKTKHDEFNLTTQIKAVNRSMYHSSLEMIKSFVLAKYVERTQRVAAMFSIVKPNLGHDHTMTVLVKLYPFMEMLDIQEITGFNRSMDEELTDSRYMHELWKTLVSRLDAKFAPIRNESTAGDSE